MKQKLSKTKQISFNFLNRLLNIAPHEWPKVIYCFLLKFFADTGKVIGHTVILSLAATRLGVSYLPIIFIVTGILIIIGTSIFSQKIEKISKPRLVMGLTLSAGVLFILARFVLGGHFDPSAVHAASIAGAPSVVEHVPISTYIFFLILLVAEGVFFVQMEIVLALLIEGYFTPLESQRTFPIIESAAVIAGIFGGILLTFIHLHVEDLLFLWAGVILLIIPTIMIYKRISQKVPLLKFNDKRHNKSHHKNVEENKSLIKELKHGVKTIVNVSFLKYTMIIVFLYYTGFYILEYQYMKAFSAYTHGADELSQLIGTYILVFSSIGLFIQLFAASRIVKALGIVRSLLLNPIVSLIGYIGMAYHFSVPTAFSSKLLFDSSSIVYKNAYLSSFYAVNHKIRETAKAMIDGWLFPAGMITGTLILLFVGKFLPHEYETVILNGCLIVIAIILSYVLIKQRKNYTNLPIRSIKSPNNVDKQEAIEILGEKGHVDALIVLIQQLRRWKGNSNMIRAKVKILETFGRLKEVATIPVIIDFFDSTSVEVQIASVQALGKFETIGKDFLNQMFTRYRIVNSLKELFLKTNSSKLRKNIVQVFANLRVLESIPFLIELLKQEDPELKADAINVMGKFSDPNIYHYLNKYINDSHPRIKANTIIALWQFKQYRLELIMAMTSLIDKKADKDVLASGVYLLGELRSKQEEKLLLELLEHEDDTIKRHAAIALAKIEHNESFNHVVRFIFHDEKEHAKKTYEMLMQVPKHFRARIMNLLHQEVSKRIHEIMIDADHNVEILQKEQILELIGLYEIVDQHTQIVKLEGIIINREKKLHAATQKSATNNVASKGFSL